MDNKKIKEYLEYIFHEKIKISNYKEVLRTADAIVYSPEKKDHKFVFLKSNAPSNITPDRLRKKGRPYIKSGRKIYDVIVDMYEIKNIMGGDGKPVDIWIVDNIEQAQNQLNNIIRAGATQFHPKILTRKK